MPFWGHDETAADLWDQIPQNPNIKGVNSRFQA